MPRTFFELYSAHQSAAVDALVGGSSNFHSVHRFDELHKKRRLDRLVDVHALAAVANLAAVGDARRQDALHR